MSKMETCASEMTAMKLGAKNRDRGEFHEVGNDAFFAEIARDRKHNDESKERGKGMEGSSLSPQNDEQVQSGVDSCKPTDSWWMNGDGEKEPKRENDQEKKKRKGWKKEPNNYAGVSKDFGMDEHFPR